MINGLVAPRLCSDDLGLERRDTLVAFGNRQGVEILPDGKAQRVARTWRRCDVVGVHDAKVARTRAGVNRSRENLTRRV